MLSALFAYGFYDEFIKSRSFDYEDPEGRIVLLILGTVIITGIFVCRYQVQLRATIRHNYNKEVENFLNSHNN